jgi:hypothetical protein
MKEKGLWKEGDSVFGLPKIKTVRIKIKKGKAATAQKETVAETPEKTPSSSGQASTK